MYQPCRSEQEHIEDIIARAADEAGIDKCKFGQGNTNIATKRPMHSDVENTDIVSVSKRRKDDTTADTPVMVYNGDIPVPLQTSECYSDYGKYNIYLLERNP